MQFQSHVAGHVTCNIEVRWLHVGVQKWYMGVLQSTEREYRVT